jgi:hypothetical protein
MPQSDANANQSATSNTTSSTTSTTSDQNANTSNNAPDSGAAAGANSSDQGTGSRAGRLPSTATPLPLLALLGFGSLITGFVTRRRK